MYAHVHGVYVCVCVCAPQCMCGSQRTILWSQFSLSTLHGFQGSNSDLQAWAVSTLIFHLSLVLIFKIMSLHYINKHTISRFCVTKTLQTNRKLINEQADWLWKAGKEILKVWVVKAKWSFSSACWSWFGIVGLEQNDSKYCSHCSEVPGSKCKIRQILPGAEATLPPNISCKKMIFSLCLWPINQKVHVCWMHSKPQRRISN